MEKITTPVQNGSANHLNLQTAPDPQQKLEQGKSAAKVLMTVANPVTINGKAYLRYEDLQTIAAFFQCTAGTSDPEYIEVDGVKGYKANAKVRNKDGIVISTASAFCLREGNWADRENFALASMAQTRAAAKALRNAFGWIVTLSGFEATPAEEMTFQSTNNVKEQHQPEVDAPATDKQLNTLTNLLDNPYLENQERWKLSEVLMHEISKTKASDIISYYFGVHVLQDGKWVKIKDGVLDSRKNDIPE